MTTRVKICGIRTASAALVAADAGADLLGFCFVPNARRFLGHNEARAVIEAVRAHRRGGEIEMVGLFVNETPAVIDAVAADVGLDWAQLCGNETVTAMQGLDTPALKTIRFTGEPQETSWLMLSIQGVPLVVDAHVQGAWGGTGVIADWQRAAEYAQTMSLMLAGGLTPANVADAIRAVRPWAVDVSSGVETDGVQDHAKIRAFVQAAKNASL